MRAETHGRFPKGANVVDKTKPDDKATIALHKRLTELDARVTAQANLLVETMTAVDALSKIFQERISGAVHAGEKSMPVVGDAVHFYTIETSRQTRGMAAGPYCALVLRTEPEFRECDLAVWSPARQPMLVPAVKPGSPENLDLAGSDDEVAFWWEFPK